MDRKRKGRTELLKKLAKKGDPKIQKEPINKVRQPINTRTYANFQGPPPGPKGMGYTGKKNRKGLKRPDAL